MGSKKKKEESESSSSSSDSDSSDSSPVQRSKQKNKKRRGSVSDSENVKKSKYDDDKSRNKKNQEGEKEDRRRKRRRSPSPPNKDRQRKREEDDKKTREDRIRYDERRSRQNDHNDRRYEDRYTRNRPDHRDWRDDRERDYRNQRNDRERDYKDRRDDNRNRDRDRNRKRSRSSSFDHANAKWGRSDKKPDEKDDKSKEKQKPNFGLSGKLTEERNTFKGVVIKYSEPPEARKPKRRWRLYPFKGEKALQTLYIHRESAYLIGRDRKVVDLPVDHPSCSKQHAVLQYRLVPFTRDDGSTGKRVRPYLIDLDSANGTFINNKKIEPKKYVELLEKDVIKFGFSSREYVLLHENSKDEAQDDDVKVEEEVVVKNEEN